MKSKTLGWPLSFSAQIKKCLLKNIYLLVITIEKQDDKLVTNILFLTKH